MTTRLTDSILAQIPGNPCQGLAQADRLWQALRQGNLSVPHGVQADAAPLGTVDWDVIICGGTLGICIGAALAQQGWRVAVLERGALRGREQEWNVSRSELQVFLDLGLLSPEELAQAIATTYNPARISFGGPDYWVQDVLNLGVDPVYLLERLKQRFLAAGGQLLECTEFAGATLHPDGVAVRVRPRAEPADPSVEQTTEPVSLDPPPLRGRLLLDAMGHFSPIARQARQGQAPDGVCLVVGTCARGFPQNETGDLLVSFTPIQNHCQYFWEAFPARDGRTTYLFTYVDAHPDRPSLSQLFEDYLRLLPDYQGVALADLQWQRALFGFFPSYRQSPLRLPWDRVLPIGDSSSSQSPLSFGGFGAMLRHLHRLSTGIGEALACDRLDRRSLQGLQPYQPNLAVTWLFQQTMSVRLDQNPDPNQINHLLDAIFGVMAAAGDGVLKPFLQDVVQFPALSVALSRAALRYPGLIFQILPQVGPIALLDWSRHYLNLGAYAALTPLAQALAPWVKTLPPKAQYTYHRWQDAWTYGSGNDRPSNDR